MEKYELPVTAPASDASSRGPSRWARPLLVSWVLLAALGNFYPQIGSVVRYISSSASPHANIYETSSRWSEEWLAEHAKCPVQPKPLHPKMVWNMTDKEKQDSLEKFAAAVVGFFNRSM
jgi:Gly-Xaa carboxypeptidase